MAAFNRAFGVVRLRVHDGGEPGNVQKPALPALTVVRAQANAGAVGGAQHHRSGVHAAVHVVDLSRVIAESVSRYTEEVGET